MNPNQLNGKKVVDSEGRVLGEISGIEIDLLTWTVTHLCINLSEASIKTYGYDKPFLGKVVIDLPIDAVKQLGDVAILKNTITELKNIIEPHDS